MAKRLVPLYAVYEKRTAWSLTKGITTRWKLISVCLYVSDAINLMQAAYPNKTLEQRANDIQYRILYKWEVSD